MWTPHFRPMVFTLSQIQLFPVFCCRIISYNKHFIHLCKWLLYNCHVFSGQKTIMWYFFPVQSLDNNILNQCEICIPLWLLGLSFNFKNIYVWTTSEHMRVSIMWRKIYKILFITYKDIITEVVWWLFRLMYSCVLAISYSRYLVFSLSRYQYNENTRRDNEKTRLWSCEITRIRGCEITRTQEYEITTIRDNESTRRDNENIR